MSASHELEVALGERRYPIRIGRGLLGQPEALAALVTGRHVLVLTDGNVAPFYLAPVQAALREKQLQTFVLPPGEQEKTLARFTEVMAVLAGMGASRDTTVLALGGGVVGDLAGFAAACWMRGVRFVQLPTTLLAMVDSSVGGKTAVDLPQGKNLVGAFHQPAAVLADTATLDTLPEREFSAGLAEVVKYGAIADAEFFAWLEDNAEALMARNPDAGAHAIATSCRHKAGIVARDETEQGERMLLNFGHTFGHAIEAGLGYGEWLHGEAVGCGMVMAATLSERLGLVDAAFVARLTRLIAAAGLPVKAPLLHAEDNAGAYLDLMRHDKKSEAGEIRFVVIDGPGRAALRSAPDALVREVIDACSL